MSIYARFSLAILVALGAGWNLQASESRAEAMEAQVSSQLPPEGSPPLLRNIELLFPAQGNVSSVDPQTYLYYMEVRNHVSLPSQDKWVPYTQETEEIIRSDFHRLWDTGFLDDLSIEVIDEPYENGVLGKRVIFNFEERARVKIVTFEGSDEIDRGDIDTAMTENGLSVRLDSFLDLSKIGRTTSLLKFMFAEKGYQFAEISHEIEALPGGVKIVQLKFLMDEGPKIFVDEISFAGNEVMSDRTLRGQMASTKQRNWLSWITGRGTYKAAQFEGDADRIIAYYRSAGYIDAQVGQPDLEYLEKSEDGKNQALRMNIPIDEGDRYRLGEVKFDGNEAIEDTGLSQIFGALESGDYYKDGEVRTAFESARQIYGSIGYYEMTLFPDLLRRGQSLDGNGDEANGNGELVADQDERPTYIDGAPVVDVTIRIQEGEQYFVNRITFVGNDTTHDEVIRRELQLVERGVFDTEAMKYSVRRLNQLGYFEPLEENEVGINHSAGEENEVDLTFDLTETNLNQLSFGAGVSQFDGFFGQLSFQTSNFLGQGKTLDIGLQSGSRVRDFNLTFTEPYLFGRPWSASGTLFSRRIEWLGSWTEESHGTNFTIGWPLAYFTRLFVSYGYEQTEVSDVNPSYTNDTELLATNPFFTDQLMLSTGGRRTVSKITPMVRLNTVDHPIFPRSGKAYSIGIELAGLGGNTKYLKPILEGTWYIPTTARTTFGFRMQFQALSTSDPSRIPVFERLWLGGEYSVRGFDIRRIGTTLSDVNPEVSEDSYQGRTVLGGNKSLLFNFEYQFTVADPVRVLAFYDAGQVRNFGSSFTMRDFKISTGIELRFFMPMLNVPFRLIYAWNPQRSGVYNDQLRRQEDRVFRFAVGTMF